MMQEIDYKGLFDRLEILVDRLYKKPKKHRKKRQRRYHKLALKQLKFLRQQLE
ncbi:MAG: hypothetical protein AAF518_25370 [Spirochaetota bacterium]